MPPIHQTPAKARQVRPWVEKKHLSQKRGEVVSLERRRDISRKIVQGLAIVQF